jgi:hypothetical protein
MDANTKEVIEQFGTKLDSYIQVLAEKLGVAAEYVYPLFVKQQVIEGVWFFSVIIFVIILSLISFVIGIRAGKKVNFEDGGHYAFSIIGGIVFLTSLFTFCLTGGENFSKIMNPEYAAIKEIVRMVK